MNLFSLLLMSCLLGTLSSGGGLRSPGKPVEVFISGEDGYHTYRIPAIIRAKDGSLLAFAEGRRGGQGDSGDIDLVLKRSTDGGVTWSAQRCLWDDGPNTCGNPCPVVDRSTGRIHLLMTRNLGSDHERMIIDQTSAESRSVWVMTTDDHGRTWSTPREITASTKQPNWTWYATGPGNGIQLQRGKHAGRLVVPCDHIEAGTKKYFSHVILSDDGGVTWRLGGRTPTDQVNECAVAELSDGRLLLNMRNYDRSQRTRAQSRSRDGGLSWSEVVHEDTLPEPICQASMIALDGGRRLVFSNPASSSSRTAMTVRTSDDGGVTWSEGILLHAGPSAYSCLTELADGGIGCLYERGTSHPYESIRFERVPLTPHSPSRHSGSADK